MAVQAVASSAKSDATEVTHLQRILCMCVEEGAGASQHRNLAVFDKVRAPKYLMPLALEQGFLRSAVLLLTALTLV